MRSVSLLNVAISIGRREEYEPLVRTFLTDGKAHIMVTPNPEMLLLARRHEDFRTVLNAADCALPDGFGLVLAGLTKGIVIPRMTGTDFLPRILLRIAEQAGASVYFLGGGDDVAARAAQKMSSVFRRLRVAGAESGGLIERLDDGTWRMESGLLDRIRTAKPDILVVALGQHKQELWIRDHLPHLPSVKIAIGVGGALDYLSGTIRRAPHSVRALGCEWIWRLIREPRRLHRIINAVIVFPIVFLYDTATKKTADTKTTP